MGGAPMKYVNTKTGAIIETESNLGGGWVVATQPKPKVDSNNNDKPVKKETKRAK